MIVHSREPFDLYSAQPASDSGYGSATMLGCLVREQDIGPQIPVFAKSERPDCQKALERDPGLEWAPGGGRIGQG
jgi:hypothetical protein